MLRTIYFFGTMILYFLLSFFIHYPLVLLSGKRGTKLARKFAQNWGKFIFRRTGSKVQVIIEDEEDLKQFENESFVLVSNHQSNIDIPLILGYFPIPVGFVAKKEMATWPLMGFWMKRIQCVFLDRKNPREGIKSMKVGIELIKSGFSVSIFPEGTRSLDGSIGEFKRGSFKLASEPKVKIIPVTIKGSIDILGKEKLRVKKSDNVKLIIGKSIDPSGMERDELKALNERVRDIIIKNYEKY